MSLIYPHKTDIVIKTLDERIDANSHKGNTWQTCSLIWLKEKMKEEYIENLDYPYNIKELADLSNICNMMIWRCAKV